ncbi:MAG: NAD-dependent epimerase/dehydratase family protein [Deltaproteobacteria bacterium]|nr:NAD-dependent epimerase/dehydratase family protein [Candidatus Zymogenaceae bacterium]
MKFTEITLVTGAAGFMGSHVVEYLAKSGVKVRASARPRKDTSFFDRLGVQYVAADLTKPETVGPLFAGDVDRVIHMGAICNFSTPYERLYPTNVAGVALITDEAKKAGVKRFVHVTSTSVYGPYTGSPFREDSPRNPQDDYGKSKRDGENMLSKALEKGLDAVLCRPCTVYGPRCTDGAGKAFSRPTSITAIPGSGTQLLANVRAEDVARAVVHLSELSGNTGQAYNIVDDSKPTIERALTLAALAFGKKPPSLHLPLWLVKIAAKADGFVSARKGKVPDLEYDAVEYLYHDYVVDNTKLKKTGFTFTYPDFEKSMEEIAQLYRDGKLEMR